MKINALTLAIQAITLVTWASTASGAAVTSFESSPPAIQHPPQNPFVPITARSVASERKSSSSVATPRHPGHKRFSLLINDAARRTALDPALVHALIAVESGYNPDALSPKGAVGLMQVLPETASRYGVADPASSPEANLRAGTRYLSYLMVLFESRVDLALAAYNAGENAVLRHGNRIPPFRETQRYVPAVLKRYSDWRETTPITTFVPAGIFYMPGTVFQPAALDALLYRYGGSLHRDRH